MGERIGADGPRVGVVIPVHNGEAYLAEALGSVLAQDHRPLDVVVVDDGSTDGSGALAAGWGAPVRVLAQPRAGQIVARNRGASAACGDWLAFLDADDLWLPDKLRLQLAAATAAGADVVFGMVEHFVSPELDEAVRRRFHCPPGIARGHLVSALLVRRAAFERVGPFDTTLRVGELLDWYARATDLGLPALTIPQLVLRRRVHGGNTSLRERAAQRDYPRALKAMLDRRRASGVGRGG